jgi:hypothetical protein
LLPQPLRDDVLQLAIDWTGVASSLATRLSAELGESAQTAAARMGRLSPRAAFDASLQLGEAGRLEGLGAALVRLLQTDSARP